MSTKPGLRGKLTISAAVLTVGVAGCGTSTTPTTTEATTSSPTTSQSPTTSSSSPTTSSTTSTSPKTAPSATASAADPVLIRIKAFKFTVPPSAGPGVKVAVKNEDAEAHTVTSVTKGVFDANVPPGGKAVSFTAPTKPGKYPFTCSFHGNMMGTLVVK